MKKIQRKRFLLFLSIFNLVGSAFFFLKTLSKADSSLLFQFPLEQASSYDSTTTIDDSRVTARGDYQFVVGYQDNAFDSSNGGYIEITDSNADYDFSGVGDQFSVDAWVKKDTFENNGYQRVVGKMNEAADENTWTLGIDHAGGVYCAIWDNVNGDQHALSTGLDDPAVTLTNGAWNHIACSWDGTTGTLTAYLNDVAVASLQETLQLPSSTASLAIAAQPKWDAGNPWGDQGFYGLIDEVSVYSGLVDYTGATPTPTDTPTPTSAPSISLDSVTYQKSYVIQSDTSYLSFPVTEGSGITDMQLRNGDSLADDNAWVSCYYCGTGEYCAETSESYECDLDASANEQLTTYQIRVGDGNTWTDPDFFDVRAKFSDNFQVWLPFNTNTGSWYSAVDGSTDLGVIFSDPAPSLSTGPQGSSALVFGASTGLSLTDEGGLFDLYDVNNDAFRIRLLVKPSADNAGQHVTLIDHPGQWYFEINSSSQLFGEVVTAVGEIVTVTGTQALQADTWQWVSMSWDPINKLLAVQVDGQDNPDLGIAIIHSGLEQARELLKIANEGGSKFSGEMDDLMIFRGGFDIMPPEVSFTDFANTDRYTDNTPTFHATITDDSGVAGVQYYFQQGRYLPEGEDESYISWQTASPDDGSWGGSSETLTIQPESSLADGTWYLFIRATDSLGNRNYISDMVVASGNLTYSSATSPIILPFYRLVIESTDSSAPYIYSQAIMTDPSVDTNPIIRGYVKDYLKVNEGDTASNVVSVQYRLDGGEWQDATAQDGSFDSPVEEFTFSFTQLLPGDYHYDIRAIDAAGNDTNTQPEGASNANYSADFSIIAQTIIDQAEEVTKEEDFTDHTNQDLVFTDSVWGNGLARLKQVMSFSTTAVFAPTNLLDIFGASYGTSTTKIKSALDGNIWILGNDRHLYYYNVTSGEVTDYGSLAADKTLSFSNLLEYTVAENHILLISYEYGPTLLYDLGNTPEDLTDDNSENSGSPYSYADKSDFSYYQYFRPFAVDTRGETTGIWATVNSQAAEAENAAYIWIDTKDTDSLADDSYTIWQNTDISADVTGRDFTGNYFDQEQNLLIAADYYHGVYICTDNGTATNKADDSCAGPTGDSSPLYVFSIIKDGNGKFWLAGDQGLDYLDLAGTSAVDDDTLLRLMTRSSMGNDSLFALSWLAGEYPTGGEVWAVTNTGRIRGINYNDSYTDTLDDTTFSYLIPGFINRIDAAYSMVRLGDDFYVATPGVGLQRIRMTRDYAESGRIEFLPTPLPNMLAIDHINLEDVLGQVSSGSTSTFNDLVSFEVSNDSGLTWYDITQGQTVNFAQPDYKLKLRINLQHGSTPVVEYLRLAYIAGTDQDAVNEVASTLATPTPMPGTVSTSEPAMTTVATPPGCASALPASAPQLISAELQSDDSVLFHFNDAEGEVTTYHLLYGTASGVYQYGATNIATKGQGSFRVSGLAANTHYYFRLLPVNVCAVGMASNELSLQSKLDLQAGVAEIFADGAESLPYSVEQESSGSSPVTEERIRQDGYELALTVTLDDEVQANKSLHVDDLEAVTDESGTASFSGVLAGNHQVSLFSNGRLYETSIQLSGTDRVQNFTLRFSSEQPEAAWKTWLNRLKWPLVGTTLILVIIFIFFRKKRNDEGDQE